MRLIAHRGFRSVHPENTLQAVEAASEVADGIEIDVRRCKSGELVVIHDETVDRVTDGRGAVADHARDELEALDVLETGHGVPTLSAILQAIPDHVGVTLDLKEQETAADALDAIATEHPHAIVSSFSRSILKSCRELDASVPLAYITDEPAPTGLEIAIDLDCAYLHPSIEACTDQLVADAHRSGMSVSAWPVTARSETEGLTALGVDGVIADRPDVRAESID
jgi:glycerophosphoryl diester phosphodiesterase